MAVQYLDIDADAGQRIDNFLLRTLHGVPRSRIYRMLRQGEVRINGGRVPAQYRLQSGDRVRIPPWHGPGPTPAVAVSAGHRARLEQAILFEDDDIIVLDKPSGMAVHGGSGISLGLVEVMRELRPDLRRLELVHRLDRDTSGCLLLAKSRAALLPLHAAFRAGRVGKTYDVYVHGAWPRRKTRVELPLARFLTPTGERRVRSDATGKTARTDLAIEAAAAAFTWLRAHPQTGRTHQIRVHCQRSGHPVVGDEKYAADPQLRATRAAGVRRLCLHARAIVVADGRGRRRFEAPLPADMVEAWQVLRDRPADIDLR